MFVKPNQLWILGIISDNLVVSFFEVWPYDPSNVRIPETIDFHRMRIRRRVTMAMVMTMMSGPPQSTFLSCRLSHKCYYKLKPPGCFIGLVGKISMVSSGNPKHSDYIKKSTDRPIKPGSSGEKCSQGQKMHARKGYFLNKNRLAPYFR